MATLGTWALLLSLVFTACGGDSSAVNANRQAKGPDSSGACPEQWNTGTNYLTIMNFVPEPLKLTAASVDCADWSGVSTPEAAWPGVIMGGGEVRTSTLEAKPSRVSWTMFFTAPTLDRSMKIFGRARFVLATDDGSRSWARTEPATRVGWNSDGTESSSSFRSAYASCYLEPLTETRVSYPNTSMSDIGKLTAGKSDFNVGLIVRNGFINIATGCS